MMWRPKTRCEFVRRIPELSMIRPDPRTRETRSTGSKGLIDVAEIDTTDGET